MALTDTAAKNAKPDKDKPAGRKLADANGLFLLVKPAGKYWRMDYTSPGGKRNTLAIGVYPTVSLSAARKARDTARALLAQGIDPAMQKRINKAAAKTAAATTFEATAREFHKEHSHGWSDGYASKWIRSMEIDIFPSIGRFPMAQITASQVLDALRQIERRGKRETAHTMLKRTGQVFRYGIQTTRCTRNPAPDLRGALQPHTVKHMAAILEPVKVGELLRAIDGYEGGPATRAALQLSALLFQRPGNIRAMQWEWVDLENAMLTIPAEAMKRRKDGKINGKPHLVPLAPQAVSILEGLRPLTGQGIYVFPGVRSSKRPMSENTVTAALRRMGYTGEEMTAHGFRAMARTLIAERFPDIQPDVVEAQLAHGKTDPLGGAYDRSKYMEQRRRMMAAWAEYLDQLRHGAEVLPFKRTA